MTRINCIEPSALTDQHLLAEYRELPRVFALARKLKPREAVPTYRMGAGHVKFFFDKTLWLACRQEDLITECLTRGYRIQHTSVPFPVDGLDNDWAPTPAAIEANLQRLRDKLAARPDFYTYNGHRVPPTFYDNLE